MYANPGTKSACPITIPCRNQLTIKTLLLPATTLRQYKQREKSYTNLLQLLKNPIPLKVKKIQIKIHAGNGNKAIESSRIWTSNKKTRKEYRF